MNMTDLIDHVVQEAGLDKRAARKAVDAVLSGITATAEKGEDVKLTGFGVFKMRETEAREGKNPKTGEPISIPAGRKLVFAARAGKAKAAD